MRSLLRIQTFVAEDAAGKSTNKTINKNNCLNCKKEGSPLKICGTLRKFSLKS